MIRIRLKNGSYGFIYSDAMPEGQYEEKSIKVENDKIAVTMDYNDIADNHCACICTMNMILILKGDQAFDLNNCSIEQDRLELFKYIHRIVKNGPVVFYKPKLKRFFKSIGSKVKFTKLKSFDDMEQCISDGIPFAMMVNAGITKWHWILVKGIRKYEDGSIYLNILDGWNKRSDRYLKYEGRQTYIRAIKPILE